MYQTLNIKNKEIYRRISSYFSAFCVLSIAIRVTFLSNKYISRYRISEVFPRSLSVALILSRFCPFYDCWNNNVREYRTFSEASWRR